MRVIMPAIIDQAGRQFNVDEADGVSRRHTLASQTQRRRSVRRSLGRVTVLLYTASWRWPPQRKGKRRSTCRRRVLIKLGLSPDQS
jgi:hypothetical protein